MWTSVPLMDFSRSALSFDLSNLTPQYYQQFQRSLPPYADDTTPNATQFQQTRCTFHSGGHVHMRESMSKDYQFGHMMTSECCQVTMGGRI
jgi:hypothetical protein